MISQITRISGNPNVITLSIGGNDAGFAKVLENCITRDCVELYAKPSGDILDERIAEIGIRLPRLYRAIRRAAPKSRLIIVGYPRLFPDASLPTPVRNCAALDQIKTREAAYLNSRLDALNAAGAAAARDVGVEFIDVTDAFDGQELRCSGPSLVNRLHVRPTLFPASFHPTAEGHARLAEVVARRLSGIAPPAAAD